jgi:integrase
VAYIEQRKMKDGSSSYRGRYKTADGKWRTAGTFSDPDRALEVAIAAEEHAQALVKGVPPELDPVTKATMTIAGYRPGFLRHHRVEGNSKDDYATTLRVHVVPFIGGARLAEFSRTAARNYVTALIESGRSANTIRKCKVALGALFAMAIAEGYLDEHPFHGVRIPKVSHGGAIKVMTQAQFLRVRRHLPNEGCKVLATVLVSSGIRPCEAWGLRPEDFDFDADAIDVMQSVVAVSREHHPEGKTFLIRDYTKNGTTRRVPVDSGCARLVKDYIARHGFARSEVIFRAELLIPPRQNKDVLSEEEIAALGFCAPVNGKTYRHGTMAGYTTAKCRCEGCRQWSRQYARKRLHDKSGRRRWEKSRDADEPYLGDKQWLRIWNAALKQADLPFKPTAYQVRHTHGSWLIDAGENPKAVMHRLGQSDLRVTSRYVQVLDEEGASAANRFEGLLPGLDE